MAPRDNRYAWRLNCEDGSAYGIDPNDYETRDEYNEALNREKHGWRDYCEDGSDYGISPEDYETEEEYDEALENVKADSFDADVDLPNAHQIVAVTRLENMSRMQQMISMYMFTAL